MTAGPAEPSGRGGSRYAGGPGPAALILVAVWAALATGILELGGLALRNFVNHKPIVLGLEVLWMAPAGNLLWFLPPAAVLALVSGVAPRLLPFGRAATLLIGLGVLGLVLAYSNMHDLGVVLLTIGITVQGARLLRRRWVGFHRVVRRTTPWLAALVTLSALGLTGGRALQEWIALRSAPPPAGRYNVLLLVLDTVRAMSLSLYGYDRPTTPELERWARRGVRFEHAFATAPWTLPSHGSMFTGRWPHELSTGWTKPLDGAHPTLAQVLGDRGYRTGGFVANLYYCSEWFGLDRGFVHYDDFPVSPGMFVVSTAIGRRLHASGWLRRLAGYHDILGRKSAADVNRSLLDWIGDRTGRPFFAFANYYDAHEPYLPPAEFERRFESSPLRRANHRIRHQLHEADRSDKPTMTPEEIRRERDAYDASIAYLDREIGALLDSLDRRGVLERTLVIITSDHGEQFGEHGLLSHGNSTYLPSIQVPLVLLFPPAVPQGRTIPGAVSLRRIPSTVVDLLGIEGVNFPGRSLARRWKAPPGTAPGPFALSELRGVGGDRWASVIGNGLHYIRRSEGEEELYRLDSDPLETADLSDSASAWDEMLAFRLAADTLLDLPPSAHVLSAEAFPPAWRTAPDLSAPN